MFGYLLLGSSFAFAAAVQPGPLQAFLLSSVARRGWRRTLPASFAPMISDVPIAFLTIFLLNHVPEIALRILQAAGGILLLLLAGDTLRRWKRGREEQAPADGSGPRTLLSAVLVNVLNPNPYLGWTLVLGPAAVRAWHENPAYALALVASFYGVMAAGLAATIVLFGATQALDSRWRRALLLASALILAALGAIQLVLGILRLVPRG